MAGDDDEMFMTRSLNVTPKTTEQHLIVRSDKSVAYVTNNKRLPSTYCVILLKLTMTDTKHRAACLREQISYFSRWRPSAILNFNAFHFWSRESTTVVGSKFAVVYQIASNSDDFFDERGERHNDL